MKSRILVATSCMLCLLCTLNVEASVPKKSKATPVQTKEQKEVIKEDTLFDLSQSLTDNVSSTDSDSSYDDDKPMPLGAITIRNGIAYRHDDNKPLGGPTKRKKQATPEKTKQQTTSKQQITENKENSTINYNDIRKELCSENITKDRLTEILKDKDLPEDIRESARRRKRMLILEERCGREFLESDIPSEQNSKPNKPSSISAKEEPKSQVEKKQPEQNRRNIKEIEKDITEENKRNETLRNEYKQLKDEYNKASNEWFNAINEFMKLPNSDVTKEKLQSIKKEIERTNLLTDEAYKKTLKKLFEIIIYDFELRHLYFNKCCDIILSSDKINKKINSLSSDSSDNWNKTVSLGLDTKEEYEDKIEEIIKGAIKKGANATDYINKEFNKIRTTRSNLLKTWSQITDTMSFAKRKTIESIQFYETWLHEMISYGEYLMKDNQLVIEDINKLLDIIKVEGQRKAMMKIVEKYFKINIGGTK